MLLAFYNGGNAKVFSANLDIISNCDLKLSYEI